MKNVYLIAAVAVCAAAVRELEQGAFLFSALFMIGAFVLLIKGGAADPEERDEKSRLKNSKHDK